MTATAIGPSGVGTGFVHLPSTTARDGLLPITVDVALEEPIDISLNTLSVAIAPDELIGSIAINLRGGTVAQLGALESAVVELLAAVRDELRTAGGR